MEILTLVEGYSFLHAPYIDLFSTDQYVYVYVYVVLILRTLIDINLIILY